MLFLNIQKFFKFDVGIHKFQDGLHIGTLGIDEGGAGIGHLQRAGIALLIFAGDIFEHPLVNLDGLLLVNILRMSVLQVIAELALLDLQAVLGLGESIELLLVRHLGALDLLGVGKTREDGHAEHDVHGVWRGHIHTFAEVVLG